MHLHQMLPQARPLHCSGELNLVKVEDGVFRLVFVVDLDTLHIKNS